MPARTRNGDAGQQIRGHGSRPPDPPARRDRGPGAVAGHPILQRYNVSTQAIIARPCLVWKGPSALPPRRRIRHHRAMVDPITVAVLQNRLNAIAEEMGEAMLRTAYSQILNSSRDFSIVLIDRHCRLIAQADHIPVHVGAMSWAAKALMARFPDPAPDDVYLLNDPYRGGSHLPDLTAFVPIFADGRLLFWSVVRAHHSDIGGATHGAYNPAATEIWHEGLRIPPMRLTENGVLREDLLEMLALNVRHPRDFRGDLAAQIGAARLGHQRLTSVIAEFGAPVLESAVEAMLDAAERHARSIVSTWKDGVYDGEAVLDDDGFDKTNIVIRAHVIKQGSDVTVDLSESDPQVTGFINSSHANSQSAVAIAFAFLLDPGITKNDGAFRPLKVILKEGTIVWAREGAPVTMCTSHCSNEIIEAIIVALAQSCPERAMGGWGRRLRIALNGADPRTGPGGGGSSAGDGYSTIGEWHSAGGIKFGSIEVAESRFPLVFETHEYRADSAGDGQFRGGYGGDMRLRVETDGVAMANTAGEGIVHGARGILGGHDGAPHDYTLLPPDGPPRKLKSKEINVPVAPGSVIHVLSGGGGGWGDPARRDPASRAHDAAEGLTGGNNR
jgi:N-methylhydantoinase B